MLNGVAHIRISTSPCEVDGDFYAVFVCGQMSPIKFESWIEAFRHFRTRSAEVARANRFEAA